MMWRRTERRNKRCLMSPISRIDLLPPLGEKKTTHLWWIQSSREGEEQQHSLSVAPSLVTWYPLLSRTFHLCLLYFRSDTFPQKMHLPVCYVLTSSVQNSSRSFFFHQVFRRKTTVSFNSVGRAFNHIILLNYPQVSAHLTPVESNLSAGSSAPASAVGPVGVGGVCGGLRVQERDR